MRAFNFTEVPSIAVANGATTPTPSYASQCFAWSSTLARPVVWDGAAWERLATFGETLRNTTDTLTGNLTVTGQVFANVVNGATGGNFGGPVGIATTTGTTYLSVGRGSLGTGQTTINLVGGTGSSNWQIFQQIGVSDLGFYSAAYNANVLTLFTTGAASFAGAVSTPGQLKSTKAGAGTIAAVMVETAGGATYAWRDPSAGTDAKLWDMYASGNYLVLRTLNDPVPNTFSANIMMVTRSGATVTSIAFGAPTSIAGLATATQFKSAGTAGGAGSAFLAEAAGGATFGWRDSSAGTDAKTWDMICNANTLQLRTVNDANTAAANIMLVTRSGNTVASIAFGATTSVAGQLTSTGNAAFADVTASRGNGTGVIYLGGTSRYLYYDGANYNLVNAPLYVNGTYYASDIRYKRAMIPIDDIAEKLLAIEAFTYTETESDERRIGVSAQSVAPHFPEAIGTDKEGRLSVAYGNLALAALVEYVKFNERRERERAKV